MSPNQDASMRKPKRVNYIQTKTLGKREQSLLIHGVKNKMPRGTITRYEIQSKLFKLKDQLREEHAPSEYKYLADTYLNKILDYVDQFRY